VPLSKPAQDILAPADAVEITTSGGETLQSGPVEFARGSHQRPLSRDELWVKFTDCLGPQFTDAKKSRAFEKLMIFDRLALEILSYRTTSLTVAPSRSCEPSAFLFSVVAHYFWTLRHRQRGQRPIAQRSDGSQCKPSPPCQFQSFDRRLTIGGHARPL
jgi:hypothetical protein